MQNPPFFYKVSFHFLAQDPDNELKHESWQKDFHNSDPYIARKDAFEAFQEYLLFLESTQKVELDSFGNPKIISPSDIPKEPQFPQDTDKERGELLKDYFTNYTSYHLEFEETLDVLLVITDDSILEAICEVDYVLAIHSVSSHSVPKQVILDNLSREVDLYEKCNYSPFDHTVEIQHFGEDFAESGEEVAENYAILPTPFIWTTQQQYKYWKLRSETTKEVNEQSIWESIIEKGESKTLEFKPSLVYNFLPGAPNYLPLFNNARTICGFLNSNGGVLLIGVSDNGEPQGLEKDLQLLGSRDKLRLKIDQFISSYFNNSIASLIEVSFEEVLGIEVLVIKVKPSGHPIFLKNYIPVKNNSSKHFYVRRSASTTEIKDVEEIINYVFHRWGKN